MPTAHAADICLDDEIPSPAQPSLPQSLTTLTTIPSKLLFPLSILFARREVARPRRRLAFPPIAWAAWLMCMPAPRPCYEEPSHEAHISRFFFRTAAPKPI